MPTTQTYKNYISQINGRGMVEDRDKFHIIFETINIRKHLESPYLFLITKDPIWSKKPI